MTMNQRIEHELQILCLPDERRLSFAEYGAPDGSPVLFFHGAPGSSHIHADMSEMAAKRNIRLIAADRPGYGLSDQKQGHTLTSWADDIAVLTDALGLDNFSIIGFSMGSIYALACADRLPHRVRKMALAGAIAPLDAPGVTEEMSATISGLYTLAQTRPYELAGIFAILAQTPSALLAAMSASSVEADRIALQNRCAEFETEYTRALRGGVVGMAADFILASKDWGFRPDNIGTEIEFWYGTADCNTPPAMTNYLTSILPNSRCHKLPNEGHFALYEHWDEILGAVAITNS
jgi:pimeloyl-ACP methyl ester carboxylesterase